MYRLPIIYCTDVMVITYSCTSSFYGRLAVAWCSLAIGRESDANTTNLRDFVVSGCRRIKWDLGPHFYKPGLVGGLEHF